MPLPQPTPSPKVYPDATITVITVQPTLDNSLLKSQKDTVDDRLQELKVEYRDRTDMKFKDFVQLLPRVYRQAVSISNDVEVRRLIVHHILRNLYVIKQNDVTVKNDSAKIDFLLANLNVFCGLLEQTRKELRKLNRAPNPNTKSTFKIIVEKLARCFRRKVETMDFDSFY